MGLTGLAIFKLLPKTNCGECGVPTCLAFAMALAAGKATLSQCPYVSDEAREALDSATAPPIKLVKMGSGDKVLELGDEQVIFRHDKTFYHPTGIFIEVADNDANLSAKVDEINGIVIERVGQKYEVDGVAIANASGSADTFKAAAEAVAGKTDKAIILLTECPTCMEAAAGAIAARKPLLYAATADNYEKMVEVAKKVAAPLAVKGADLNAMAELVAKIDYKELVIDSGARQISQVIADQTQIRNGAVKKRFRPYGYPTIAFTTEADPAMEVLEAQAFISKYASIVVLKTTKTEYLMALFTWRSNLYTDPQKPIAVQPGVYAIGAANDEFPGVHHHQLLADLLHGGHRSRVHQAAELPDRLRYRRSVRHDRLGRRQVHRRGDRPLAEGFGDQPEGQQEGYHHPGRCGGHQGQDRGSLRLGSHGRTT